MSLINLVCSMIKSSPVVSFGGSPLLYNSSSIELRYSREK